MTESYTRYVTEAATAAPTLTGFFKQHGAEWLRISHEWVPVWRGPRRECRSHVWMLPERDVKNAFPEKAERLQSSAECRFTWESHLYRHLKSSLPSVFLSVVCVCSDSGRGTLSQTASAAEPEHCGVDLAARCPLACGHPPRTSYPRIHCPEYKRRTAAAAGEPWTQGKL